MNIVLDEAFEEKDGGEKVAIGMIVRLLALYFCSNWTNDGRSSAVTRSS